MTRTIAALLCLLAGFSSPAAAQNLSGLCLDIREAGCTDRYLPFYGNTVDFCESSCALTEPVNIRDMDGTLYDLRCWSDSVDVGPGRVLLLTQSTAEGPRTFWIGSRDTYPIVPCP